MNLPPSRKDRNRKGFLFPLYNTAIKVTRRRGVFLREYHISSTVISSHKEIREGGKLARRDCNCKTLRIVCDPTAQVLLLPNYRNPHGINSLDVCWSDVLSSVYGYKFYGSCVKAINTRNTCDLLLIFSFFLNAG